MVRDVNTATCGREGEEISQPAASAGKLVLGPPHPSTLTTRHEVAHWTGRPAEPMVMSTKGKHSRRSERLISPLTVWRDLGKRSSAQR
jgi:hypothetical protein